MTARAKSWNIRQQLRHFERLALKEQKTLFDFQTDTVRKSNVARSKNDRYQPDSRAISAITEAMGRATTFDFRSPLYIYQGGTLLDSVQASVFQRDNGQENGTRSRRAAQIARFSKTLKLRLWPFSN